MRRRWQRHRYFLYSLGAGVAALVVSLALWPGYAAEVAPDAMFVAYMALLLTHLDRMTPEYLKKRADLEDPPVIMIFWVTALVVAVALGAFFLALNRSGGPEVVHIALGLAAVVLGWFTVHAMAGMHYAFEYYEAPDEGDGLPAARGGTGGLNFPDGDPPDGAAFLYFSYTIGMTAQVSDVTAASNAMRRRIALHAIFSFFFNTVILAAAVNLVLTLAGSGQG